jgi:glycosyltransferase involved in cell wall biosynthesis
VAVHGEVERAEAGLVVERSAASVAAALRHLLGDPAAARKLGANAERVAKTDYDWPRVAERLENLYSSLAR